MNILIFNQIWFAEDWRRAGHGVLTCGFGEKFDVNLHVAAKHIDNLIRDLPGGFQPDALLFLDNSGPLMISGLDESHIPAFFYSVDTHHHFELHSYLYDLFDRTFVAQKDYIPEFEAQGKHPIWMPLWASRPIEPSMEKQHGAVFVGSLDARLNPERVTFFEALRAKVPMLCMTGEFWKIFPHAEVVINQTVKGDLNFRVFEAMMSGAMLLTERSGNGLFDLFQDGVHLRTYTKNDVQEAAAAIADALGNLSQTREIGRQGREKILSEHTEQHRAEWLLGQIQAAMVKQRHPQRHYASALNFSIVAARCENVDSSATTAALVASMKSADLGLKAGEPMNRALACYLIRSCHGYEKIFQSESAGWMLRDLAQKYEEEMLFKLAHVRWLLNNGRRHEANDYAARVIGGDPPVVFSHAETAMQALLSAR